MVTPTVKREAVAHLKDAHEMSERRACNVIGCDRMTVRYRSRRPDDPRAAPGAGQGTPAVRLSAPADLPAPGGVCGEPQAAFPHLSRGTADGAEAAAKGLWAPGRQCPAPRCQTIALGVKRHLQFELIED